jgi:hypothetical protein
VSLLRQLVQPERLHERRVHRRWRVRRSSLSIALLSLSTCGRALAPPHPFPYCRRSDRCADLLSHSRADRLANHVAVAVADDAAADRCAERESDCGAERRADAAANSLPAVAIADGTADTQTDAERPTDRDAVTFFEKEWRWLETWDKNWEHMTPIQGDWTISSIGLPASVLRKIYFDNARRILARSLPAPVAKAARIRSDFEPDGALDEAVWDRAQPVWVEYGSLKHDVRAELATRVRVLYSDQFIYFGWESPFTKLTVFETPSPDRERLGLWDRDVVEVFIGSDWTNINRYAEYEVAPTNERLDVLLNLPAKEFGWDGRAQSAVKVDRKRKVWTVEWRMPLEVLSPSKPVRGDRWRLNLYRCDRANDAFLAWNPVLKSSFHTPAKFGVLEFGE